MPVTKLKQLSITLLTVILAANIAACAVATPPTATPEPTAPPAASPSPRPSSTPQPITETPPPTTTPQPSLTPSPTARNVLNPTLGFYAITPENTPVTAVPSPVPAIKLDDDVKNILLIGSDSADDTGSYRSDTLIVVSINRAANTVTMLSIPRDLYVFIPRSKVVMGRINSVINIARNMEGGPIPLLEQTILYNLGLPIHYYARVDFNSFKQIVDALGGVDIPVTCSFQDWRLKDPSLDPQVEDNWHLFTLDAGLRHLDGDTALWYARARQVGRKGSGSDFDRARRQQEVLRAIFHKARSENLWSKVPALYAQYQSAVETDMGLGDVLQFVPLALALDDLNIRSYKISPPYTQGWTTPNDGASVQLPVADEFYKYVQRVMSAGGTNRVSQTPFAVEVWNGTTWADADDLAAYRLRVEGYRVTVGEPDHTNYPTTTIIDYTTSSKGSPIENLKKLMHIQDPVNVIAQPDANSPAHFRVILGANYNSCTYQVAALTTPTPSPSPASATPTPAP